ncbi:MAG: hydroxyacylglutathione hydrolase [Pseudomonadota bacterium]|jgi:hydroxyacylglutathione hydrolase
MEIHAIPAFEDNIIWALEFGGQLVVVDPGDADPVTRFLEDRGLLLAGILITHHHGDHTGGIRPLVEFSQAQHGHRPPVYGPAQCLDFGVTQVVDEGAEISLIAEGLRLSVLSCPGHTTDHIAFFGHPANQPPVLFCGDTLFAGGCGKLLGGTAAQLYRSLQRFAGLPAETAVYCAHEYTLNNLLFAAAILPQAPAIQSRLAEVRDRRARGISTLPSSIGLEKATNPFLLATSLEKFISRRLAKDSFRPARP